MSGNLNLIPPYINGNFHSASKYERVFSVYNPTNPSDILSSAGWSKELVEPVIQGMRSAQKKFRQILLDERLGYIKKLIGFLKENSEEIKSNMMLELARSRVAVEQEWALCEKLFYSLPEFCKQALSAKRDDEGWEWQYSPLGLVLVSSNISLPVYSLLCSVLPALVAGNAVCMRPSSHCLLSGSLLASGFHQASFPAGIVQIIYGDFEVFRRFVLSHQFDTILYTGGEESLEQIRRDTSTQQNARLVLCGGGKNAAYVSKSANIDNSISNIIYGACLDAGQRLESTNLAFIDNSIFSEFLDKFVTAIKSMPIGAREDLSRTDIHVMEPLCSSHSWERFLRFQGIAAREADETLRWGKPIDNSGNGYFVSPGVHLMKPEKVLKSVYASNAFFGPDVCLVPIDNRDDMILILDELGATRCLGIHSQFVEEVHEIRKRSNVPTVLWNTSTVELNPLLPSIGRGKAGNSYITGIRFLLSTVYPQVLNLSVPFSVLEADRKKIKGNVNRT